MENEAAGELAGKRALITGGAGGIGAACARRLSRLGAVVTVADRDADGDQRVATEIGGEAWQVDLSDTAALEGLALSTDILINNAGIQHIDPVEEFDPATWRRMLDIMLTAPFLLTRAALPGMYAAGWGRVINVSSIHGLVASPYKSAYVAAKHGLQGLTKTLALEAGERGVTCNCVNPGYVRTPLVESQIADQARTNKISESEVLETIMLASSAVKRLVEPDEVADLICWLAGPMSGMATGASWVLDGGWTAR